MSKKFNRLLSNPPKTFLLLGPRGTGKSTWLKMKLQPHKSIDLLNSDAFYRYKTSPSKLGEDLVALKAGDWVVIDEAQKVPDLLDEVHKLYEERSLQFAVTGSSARKLKRSNANLLAGRAIRCDLFPLVWQEIAMPSLLGTCIDFGTLPLVISAPEHAADTLMAYVSTYLKEEIAAEALTRNLEPFARFLLHAAQHHGQMLNVEAIAKEAAVKRRSVDNYFSILEETLIGFRLPALILGLRKKEAAHPKFYFFDAGVARAAAGWIRETIPDAWRGFALETLVLNELRAYNSYNKKEKNIFHYTVSQSFDIDFMVEVNKKIMNRPAEYLAIEVKLAKQWRPDWAKGLHAILEDHKTPVKLGLGIYLGEEEIKDDHVWIMGFARFCERLWGGELF